jgi:uncharacterized protein YacL (UPF0231 family)
MVKMSLQITADIGICILIDGQRCRSMLNEEVEQTDLELTNFRQMVKNLTGDNMKAAAAGREAELSLNPFSIVVHAEDYDRSFK